MSPAGPARTPGGGDDHGSITLWLLGLCVTLLFLGGVSLDLWRGFSERRALAGIADAAAVAGAGAVDEAYFRSTGEVRLDPARAQAVALAAAQRQQPPPSLEGVTAHADTAQVTVVVTGEVPLTLLRVLAPTLPALPVEVRATVEPRALP